MLLHFLPGELKFPHRDIEKVVPWDRWWGDNNDRREGCQNDKKADAVFIQEGSLGGSA